MNKVILSALLIGMTMLGPATAQEWHSVYTDIDVSNCITLATEPGYGAELACPGYKGYPLLVREGDLRMFVSYGFDARDEMAAGQTMPGFNTIGEKLEWLIADHPALGEQPVASILDLSRFCSGLLRAILSPTETGYGSDMLCSPTLDHRMLEFSGLVMATGWLRRRDSAGRSGRYIRSRCGVGLRYSASLAGPGLELS